jgi:uncharacterized lipoprotein YajG
MKNFIFATLTLAIISVLLAGCNVNQQAAQPNANTISQPQGTSLNFLISTEDSLKYCNGADMDSEGYRKTLTKKFQLTNFEANLSRAELIRKALVLAASQSGISFPQAEQTENYIKIIKILQILKMITLVGLLLYFYFLLLY